MRYVYENVPHFTNMREYIAIWVKRVADNRGQSWAQSNYDHIIGLPRSKVDRALMILMQQDFPEITGSKFYANLAHDYVLAESNNQTNATAVLDYMSTFNETNQID